MALPGYASYDIKRIAELFALLTINSYLVFSTTYRRYSYSIYSKLSRSTRLSLVGLFYLGIISSLLAPLTHWALLEVMLDTQLFYLVIFIAIHNLIWKKTSDYLLIAIILISALIYTITFFVAFMQQHANPSATYYEFPGFMNLRFLHNIK